MATLWGIYAESWSIEIANNEDQYVTADWEFDIVPFVEAHTALTAFSHSGGGSTVTSGLIECTTRDPATGIDTMNTIGSLNLFAQQNVLLAENVVHVTFGVAAFDSGGGGILRHARRWHGSGLALGYMNQLGFG